MRWQLWVSMLIAGCFSNLLMAQSALDFGIHQDYISIRAMGMGNAFAAVANDHHAIYYNPAGLARLKRGNMHAFVRAGFSQQFLDLSDDIQEANNASSDNAKLDAQVAILEKNYGNQFQLRAPSLGFFWVRPNWGISIVPMDTTVKIQMLQELGPGINVNAYNDTNITYSYARKLKWLGSKHHLWGGATIKALHRVYAGDFILATELIGDTELFETKDAAEGMTVDLDIGFLYEYEFAKGGIMDKYLKPTFALVVRNVGDYGFPINFNLLADDSIEPPKLQRRIDLGSKWDLPNFWVFDPHFAFDIRDILHDNWSIEKGTHLGFELFWEMFNWWKGTWTVGLNQGYMTAGIGAKFGIFRLDAVTFAEEVGTKNAKNEDRMYMLELSLDW